MMTRAGVFVSSFTGLCDECLRTLAVVVVAHYDGVQRVRLTPERLGEQVTELRAQCLDECGRDADA